MRLIDADKLYPDCLAKTGRVAISQSQIANAPTVEYTFEEAFQKTVCEQRLYCPQRQTGEWIKSDVSESILAKCSICGFDCGAYTHNFCPNCGAEMGKEAENDD